MSFIRKLAFKLLGVNSTLELALYGLTLDERHSLYEPSSTKAQIVNLTKKYLTISDQCCVLLTSLVGPSAASEIISAAAEAERMESGLLKRRSHVHRLSKELSPGLSKSAHNLAVELGCGALK